MEESISIVNKLDNCEEFSMAFVGLNVSLRITTHQL